MRDKVKTFHAVVEVEDLLMERLGELSWWSPVADPSFPSLQAKNGIQQTKVVFGFASQDRELDSNFKSQNPKS